MKDRKRARASLADRILSPTADEKAIGTYLGLVFLEERLAAVEARISEATLSPSTHAPTCAPVPGSVVSLQAVYQREKALIEALMQASRERPFIEVVQERLEKARRREAQLSGAGWTPGSRACDEQFWTRVEEDTLLTLLRQWREWLEA